MPVQGGVADLSFRAEPELLFYKPYLILQLLVRVVQITWTRELTLSLLLPPI
jgi:hypothetical protein